MHVLQERGGYRRYLRAIGSAKDGDAGPVEDAFRANGALSSLSNSVTKTLCSPFVASATSPGVLDEMTSALLGALTGASPWE